jgi:hypothetical protein
MSRLEAISSYRRGWKIVYSPADLARNIPSTNSLIHPAVNPVHTNSNPTNPQDNKSRWFNYLLYSLSLFLPWQSAPSLLLSTVACLRPSYLSVPTPRGLLRACPLCPLPSDLPVCFSAFTTSTHIYNLAAKVKRSSLPNDENSTARYAPRSPFDDADQVEGGT